LLAATSTAAGASLVTFALYTVEKGQGLVYAVIPASYGILRYLLIIANREGAEPIQLFLKDHQIQFAAFILLALMGWIIYH